MKKKKQGRVRERQVKKQSTEKEMDNGRGLQGWGQGPELRPQDAWDPLTSAPRKGSPSSSVLCPPLEEFSQPSLRDQLPGPEISTSFSHIRRPGVGVLSRSRRGLLCLPALCPETQHHG